jgi:hypothetical protein
LVTALVGAEQGRQQDLVQPDRQDEQVFHKRQLQAFGVLFLEQQSNKKDAK